jgi:very-short-patch-repair endonuclease
VSSPSGERVEIAPMATEQRSFARKLRRQQTSFEDQLWQQLRGRRLGYKFRRQVPLGRYVADFICFDAKLVVELDGRQHEEQRIYDAARTAEIEAQGLVVLRFGNEQVRDELESVLACIRRALARPW